MAGNERRYHHVEDKRVAGEHYCNRDEQRHQHYQQEIGSGVPEGVGELRASSITEILIISYNIHYSS